MCLLILSVGLVILVVCTGGAVAFSNGQVAASCENMLPGHDPYKPQTSESPYTVTTSSSSYGPGDRITVTLEATGNSSAFQGFLLQARAVGGRTPLGCFVSMNSTLTQGLDCNNMKNSSVSQLSGIKKRQLEVTWEAPQDAFPGDIQFCATFVKDYTEFWVRVNSPTIKMASLSSESNSSHSKISLTVILLFLFALY